MGLSDVGVGQSFDCYVDFFTEGWYNLINSIDRGNNRTQNGGIVEFLNNVFKKSYEPIKIPLE